MNYDWKRQLEKGQKSIGYVEIYSTNAKGINIQVIINYFPHLNEFCDNRICHATIFFECRKQEITDGFFHWIYDDILDLITLQEKIKFDAGTKNFRFMITEAFLTAQMPVFEYFTHGDYSKSDN